jgi:1-deoxy-D-xylulose-5-phosphate reductoisomerase
VQPQSIVHALVEFVDGSTVAQVSQPDMRLPIGLALGWPERARTPYGRMDWSAPLQLEFEPVDHATFPLLGLTIAAGREGGTAPGIANAANEEAVAAFLAGRLQFSGIAETVASVLERRRPVAGPPDLAALLAAERWSRERARTLVEEAPTRARERAPALGDDAAPRRQEE